jgi:hypothetical protein
MVPGSPISPAMTDAIGRRPRKLDPQQTMLRVVGQTAF